MEVELMKKTEFVLHILYFILGWAITTPTGTANTLRISRFMYKIARAFGCERAWEERETCHNYKEYRWVFFTWAKWQTHNANTRKDESRNINRRNVFAPTWKVRIACGGERFKYYLTAFDVRGKEANSRVIPRVQILRFKERYLNGEATLCQQ